MDFGWALRKLQEGSAVCRRGWNGKGQYIKLQDSEPMSKMNRPFIYICPVDGRLVPWLASQTDMLGTDWTMFPDDSGEHRYPETIGGCCNQKQAYPGTPAI